jgi:hypothetical protein
METQGTNLLWKRLAIGVFTVMIATGISWVSLWDYYVNTRPREVEAAQGRTIPLFSHGVVVYLTQTEAEKLRILNHTGYVLAGIFLFIYIIKKRFGEWPTFRRSTGPRQFGPP